MPLFRTMLFVPGNQPRRVEKALSTGADAAILDLEDAVAVPEKTATRSAAVAALQALRRCRGYIRVNALSTEWGYGDIVAVTGAGVDGIVLPKVETADQLKCADWLIAQIEREKDLAIGTLDLIPIVETALGFANLKTIAEARTRVRRIAFGAGDFVLDLGITWSTDEIELLPYRSAFVVLSRAAGLDQPIDTPWIDVRNAVGFKHSTEHAKSLGFQGKLCIHPDQVTVANEIFTPSEMDVARARRIVDAFAEAEEKGLVSIVVDGRFVDYPIAHSAQRVLDQVDAITAAARHR
jgi:citrate lyase subunit beta/citryl-CoA lyase